MARRCVTEWPCRDCRAVVARFDAHATVSSRDRQLDRALGMACGVRDELSRQQLGMKERVVAGPCGAELILDEPSRLKCAPQVGGESQRLHERLRTLPVAAETA